MTTGQTPNFALSLPDFRTGPWHDLVNENFTKIDQIVYGALSSVSTPLWANNTHYGVGVTAFDGVNGTTWINTVDHTSPATGTFAAARTAHPTYWAQLLAGFAPRGEWQHNTTYFPYDLCYQSSTGTLGLCKTEHISNASGNMVDDAVNWSFIYDFSHTTMSTALAVTYDSTASGLGVANVQAAIDKLETQIVGLNNVNLTQGTQITNLQNQDTADATRMTNIESKNTAQDTSITNLQNTCTSLQNQINNIQIFPSGTRIVFCMATPPAGWTIVAGIGDKAIRLVSDGTGAQVGGVQSFSTVFGRTQTDGHAITIAEMAYHHHNYNQPYSSGNQKPNDVGTAPYDGLSNVPTDDVGGNQPHYHGMDIRLAYVNMIVGNKT